MDINDTKVKREEKREKWTHQACVELINAYKSHPVLYDSSDIGFNRHTAKLAAWDKIGEQLQKSPMDCKQKMINMLSSFRRQKTKFRKGTMTTTKWFAYPHMKFLLPYQKERELKRTTAQESEEDEDEEVEEEEEEEEEEDDKADDQSQVDQIQTSNDDNTGNIIVKEEDLSKMDEDSDEDYSNDSHHSYKEPNLITNVISTAQPQALQYIIPGPSQQHASPESSILNEEVISAFTKFIQAKMKKYTTKTINAVQREISEILYKADEGLYDINSRQNQNTNFNQSLNNFVRVSTANRTIVINPEL